MMTEFTTRSGEAPQAAAEATWVVSADLAFEVLESCEVVLQVMASTPAGRVRTERFEVNTDGHPSATPVELGAAHGTRVQVLHAPPGHLTVSYRAELQGARAGTGGQGDQRPGWSGLPADGDADLARLVYLRPSRYCPSDHLVGFAVAEFGMASTVHDRVASIADWIRERVGYVAGSSTVHDSAEDTLLTGMGTCRDFAHLGVALCRAVGIPARFAAVYAPGLAPMDFHAVFEAQERDGRWYAYDATDLAPRRSMVRIVTGRDAADTAFASVNGGIATLETVEVSATTGGPLPAEDRALAVELP
jgi:transglutaminase-like putative cysteine protease